MGKAIRICNVPASQLWRTWCGQCQAQGPGCPDQNLSRKCSKPKFCHSLLHIIMFRFHILDDTSVPDPGYLPYYPASFFQLIKHVHLETPLNILTMSTSQWMRLLTEDGLTMIEENNVRKYIPCRSELSSPTTDWELVWRQCRQDGLRSDLDSLTSS